MNLQLDIVPGAEIAPEQWDVFVKQSPQGSLYALHGYATAIKPEWKAAIVSDGSGWQAVMPFFISRKFGMKAILQPIFAQYWGILFADRQFDSTYRKIQWEKTVGEQFVAVCADTHLYTMNFSPAFLAGLPFHWKGFETHIRYTQTLDLRPEESDLFTEFAGSLRRQIRKAEKQKLKWEYLTDIEELIELIHLNAQAGNTIFSNPQSEASILRSVSVYLQQAKTGYLIGAKDPTGKLLAAGLWADYQDKTLYLLGAYHPDHSSSGAMSWLMWQAIRLSRKKGRILYDFEGSMIEGIEHFFRKFNASRSLYFQIRKNQLPLLIRWIHAFV